MLLCPTQLVSLGLAASVLLGLGLPTLLATPAVRAEVEQGATLLILAGLVEVAQRDSRFEPARDGAAVTVGDSVRTGADGAALLTFFDGSETQLAPDSQVTVDQLRTPLGARMISLFQTAGSTVNRVQTLPGSPGFQTDSPAAVALVRGTTYVVTVTRTQPDGAGAAPTAPPVEPTVSYPRAVAGTDHLLLEEATYAAEDGGLWRVSTWQDPAGAQPAYDWYERIGEAELARGERLEERLDGQVFRVRTWEGTEDAEGTIYEVVEDLGVAVGQQAAGGWTSALGETPAPARELTVNAAPVASSLACERDDPTSCQTTALLLQGPDQRPSRIELQPRNRALPPQLLDQPGQVVGATARTVTAARLQQPIHQEMEQSTRNLRDAGAAASTRRRAQQTAQDIQPLLQGVRPIPGTPTPVVVPSQQRSPQPPVDTPTQGPTRGATPGPTTTSASRATPGPTTTSASRATPGPTANAVTRKPETPSSRGMSTAAPGKPSAATPRGNADARQERAEADEASPESRQSETSAKPNTTGKSRSAATAAQPPGAPAERRTARPKPAEEPRHGRDRARPDADRSLPAQAARKPD